MMGGHAEVDRNRFPVILSATSDQLKRGLLGVQKLVVVNRVEPTSRLFQGLEIRPEAYTLNPEANTRYMTQGISMMEGTLGWLGSAAKEKSKVVQVSPPLPLVECRKALRGDDAFGAKTADE